MSFDSVKISSFLPKTKNDIADVSTFVKRVDSSLRTSGHAGVLAIANSKGSTDDEDFIKLLTTLYNLDDETYSKILKDCNVSYIVYKKNAKDIDNIISKSKKPYMSLLQVLDIIEAKNRAVTSFVAEQLKGFKPEEEIRNIKETILTTKQSDLTKYLKSYRGRVNKYRIYPDLYEFINRIGTKEAFLESISTEINRKLNSRLRYAIR